MIEIKASQINENIFKLISKDWMLLTAGRSDSYNTMTANWGFMGEMWGHDTVEVVVRPERFTRGFIEKEGRFTISFFPDEMTKALEVMGTHSGRDYDKMRYPGLSAEELPSGQITFCGARLVIECDVVYHDRFDADKFIDRHILDNWYKPEQGGLHERYYGRILRVWVAQ